MTGRNPAREAERAAIAIVQHWLANKGTVWAPADGLEDFRIVYHDGRWALGEVKTDFDEGRQQLWGALQRLPRDQVLDLPTGFGGWGASVTVKASIKTLTQELPSVIESMRSHGLDYYDVRTSWEPLEIQERFLNLGLEHLSAGSASSEDVCVIFPPSISGAVPLDANAAIAWVERCLADPRYTNSWDRLAESPANEKHAFIWIESAAPEDLLLRISFHPEVPPTNHPATPDWLTHLWVGIPQSYAAQHWTWLLAEGVGRPSLTPSAAPLTLLILGRAHRVAGQPHPTASHRYEPLNGSAVRDFGDARLNPGPQASLNNLHAHDSPLGAS